MGEDSTTAGAYECEHCASVSFGDSDPTCCGESMVPLEAAPGKRPELGVVLRDVFGVSETGLRVCLCLMEDGESTATDIAERLDVDRSTVGRQLNHLTDVGMLEKRQRILKDGGYVHVYSPVPVEDLRRRLTAGLHAWTAEALELVERVNQEKLDALTRADGRGEEREEEGTRIYWDG